MKYVEKIKKPLLFILVTAACVWGAIQLYAMKPEEKKQAPIAPALKQISFVTAEPGTYPARARTFGEVRAKWTTTLRAQVGGRITNINENLLPGYPLTKGEILLQIDDTDYRAALAQAQLELENARINLIRAELRAAQAKEDWKGSGITQAPSSPLVFHGPQLKAARARVAYARKTVIKARRDLAHTTITAPYTGILTQRFADKGENLFSGDQVAKLISAGEVEIRVSLDQARVRRLGNWRQARVILTDPSTGRSWDGKMLRAGGEVDPRTRLCCFFIGVKDPKHTLMPGMFVTAAITGSPRPGLLALPESALTREGDIWIIDGQDRLRRLPARPAFYDAGRVFLETGTSEKRLRVVAMPAPGFIPGTHVAPKPMPIVMKKS